MSDNNTDFQRTITHIALDACADAGFVLHQDDAVANKVLAVFGRTEARDFLDLDAIITTGDYPMSALLRLAKDYDPGFDAHYFEGSLRQVTTINADRVAAYGVSAGEWGSVQQRVPHWGAGGFCLAGNIGGEALI